MVFTTFLFQNILQLVSVNGPLKLEALVRIVVMPLILIVREMYMLRVHFKVPQRSEPLLLLRKVRKMVLLQNTTEVV